MRQAFTLLNVIKLCGGKNIKEFIYNSLLICVSSAQRGNLIAEHACFPMLDSALADTFSNGVCNSYL